MSCAVVVVQMVLIAVLIFIQIFGTFVPRYAARGIVVVGAAVSAVVLILARRRISCCLAVVFIGVLVI